MELETTRFGKIEVDEDEIITFEDGLYGFKDEKDFVLLIDEETPFFWLQAVENPDLAFIVTEPWNFSSNYEFDLTDEVQEELNIESTEEVMVVNIVVVPDDPQEMTMNLKAPIIINKDKRLAKQIILEEEAYPVKHRLFDAKEEVKC